MKVAVFGLGYVGTVTAASLAADGHDVVGVDVNADKVEKINGGISPIVEPGVTELLNTAIANGRLRATTDTAEAIRASDVSLLCVGTPSRKNGSLDLTYLTRVCEQIGAELRHSPRYHIVVVRSTVLPGTTHGVVIPALERTSGKTYGEGFGVSVNPEFLREGTALTDFRTPPMTVVGHNHAADASGTISLYDAIDAPVVSTSIRVAEMVKYTSNTWHALKVCFAIDTGPAFGYFRVDADPRVESHLVTQQRAVLENLDAIRDKLREIEAGAATPIDTSGRRSATWGQPWLTAHLSMPSAGR